jgi:hypothetical protein
LIKSLAEQKGQKTKWKRQDPRDDDEWMPNKFVITPAKGKPWTVELDSERGMFTSANRNAKEWEEKVNCLQCGKWLN